VYELSGQRIRQVLDFAVSSDLSALKKGKTQVTSIATPKGVVKGLLKNVDNTYQLSVPAKASAVATWLRDLSDGYTSFNVDGSTKDFSAKRMPGAFVVNEVKAKLAKLRFPRFRVRVKPWFVGSQLQVKGRGAAALRVE
jgi:glycine cleavage system aminomethyltransferase T